MLPPAAGFEQHLADLEAQIERLTSTLLQWRENEDHLQPVKRRLAQLTEQCAGMLDQLTTTGERHAHAVHELETRLSDWNEIKARLQRDAFKGFRGLERTIASEWASLRELHEEPARQLREQAESLTEICVSTAGSAQTGLERAEARLSTLERDLHLRIDALSRDVQAVLAELRQRGPALRSSASPWSLDEVTRLHNDLREGAGAGQNDEPSGEGATTSLAPRAPSPFVRIAPGRSSATSGEPAAVEGSEAAGARAPDDRSSWKWRAAVAVLVLAMIVAAAMAMSFYSRANEAADRASEAQQRADQVGRAANERIEAARQDAASQIAQVQSAASRAQITSDVLAASDLVRFNLTGGDSSTRSLGQLLWSRSRGMVFSASRMPPPAPNAIYQIWLLTNEDPVSAGTLRPDPSGRVILATDSPPNVPRPVIGVRVTLEPDPGSPAPSGATVLERPQ